MHEREKYKQLLLVRAAQEKRQEQRERAIAANGDGYGVSYSILEADVPRAQELAVEYNWLKDRAGFAGKLARTFRLARLERKICGLVIQEVTGNYELAEIDQESGLWEPYNPHDDRQLLASMYAAGIVGGYLNVVSNGQ